MGEEQAKKQAADADLALTAKEAEDVKGGRKVKKKSKKRKTGGNAAGGRFQPM
jgi:hypothetical protein